MAGYRNRLVHFYHEVSVEELYQITTHHLSDLDQFIKEMGAFLESYRAFEKEQRH